MSKIKFEVLSVGRACDYGWAKNDNDWRVEMNTRRKDTLDKLGPYISFLYDGSWRVNRFIGHDYESPDRAIYVSATSEDSPTDELGVLSLIARAIQAYEEDLCSEN